ncbi:MAG TPA: magnesium transporter [Candidatus Vogelbacteria bacterium]|nr:magnesium transporter [Candidatus Vogelbacteria bacterium]
MEKNRDIEHPKESAGKLMTQAVPVINNQATVADVQNLIIKKTKDFENINYIYITDEENKLEGVISIKELFRREKGDLVKDFMETNLVVVRSRTDQEKVAMLALKHSLKDIPVIDSNYRLLGIVPSDIILDIIHRENQEDHLLLAGISHRNSEILLNQLPMISYYKKRLPWLIVGLIGGILAAFIVSFFEKVIADMMILAAFIPAVVYMADAVGGQTQIIFVRQLAIDQTTNFRSYLKKETIVGFLLSVTLSFLLALFVVWWWQSVILASILGLSFFFTIIFAIILAIVIPWLFQVYNYDPAVASGPLATVIRDIVSVIIYFVVATVAIFLFL